MKFGVVLAFCFVCLTSCRTEDSTRSDPAGVWMAIEPIQCLGNPWERDWLESHGGDYSAYPKDPTTPGLEPEEFTIIQEFYDRAGVTVIDAETKQKYDAVCLACSCPEGHTLYLLVSPEGVQTMIGFGYRLEAPNP